MKLATILATKGSNVVTIQQDVTITEAAQRLYEHKIGAMPVVDASGALVGIFSERDIVRWLATTAAPATDTVATIMTADPITGIPQDDIYSVAQLMTRRRFRHLPVVSDGSLVGIISIGDVLKAQRDQYRGESSTLEQQIMADTD